MNVGRFVLKHSGRVFAKQQVGEGATFSFTLPRSRSPSHWIEVIAGSGSFVAELLATPQLAKAWLRRSVYGEV